MPYRLKNRALLAGLAASLSCVLLGACGGGSPSGSSNTTTSQTNTGNTGNTTTGTGTTVWLCRPGATPDPCAASRKATEISSTGSTSIVAAAANGVPAVDCFYVYPTVSDEPGDNADLTIQSVETDAAFAQASRFSQVCRVWAPMYRQRTVSSLAKGLGNDPAADLVAYDSLLSAWKDYIAHDNDGRPIVFIGHSQGAAMLIRLLRAEVDNDPSVRKLLVSAIILGGNVQVPTGQDVGGSFQHIPACTSPTQVGCVIAYSSFPSQPPTGAPFGYPGQGVSLQSGQTASTGQQVLCTNPADLGSTAAAPLEPYFPSAGVTVSGRSFSTPWVAYPGRYTAQCLTGGGASWLQVTPDGTASDPRPEVRELLGPTWGFHQDDVNLALGDLVSDVQAEVAAMTGHAG